MEDELLNRAVENTLIIEIKKRNFNFIERAKLFDHLAKTKSIPQIAEDIGITRQAVYKYKSILTANKNTQKALEDGKLTGDMACRITYNLKDKSKEDEIVKRAIDEGMDRVQLEKVICETNNPDKIIEHICTDIKNFFDEIAIYYIKLSELKPNHKLKLSRLIDSSIKQLAEIKIKLRTS